MHWVNVGDMQLEVLDMIFKKLSSDSVVPLTILDLLPASEERVNGKDIAEYEYTKASFLQRGEPLTPTHP